MQEYVIIVAGGKGERMGGPSPKQFLQLNDTPVIFHTLQRFINYNPAIQIIVVVHPEYLDFWADLCSLCQFNTTVTLVSGGKERFYSVRNGLEVIEGSNGIVAVHDAVRPLVSEGTIERSFNAALAFGAAVPVMPVVDSVRVVNGTENHPVDRTRYRLVQTPQCFEINLLRDAYNQDFRLTFTDDASVVEAFGHPVQLVEGNRENIKLTTPVDMIIAESLLRS